MFLASVLSGFKYQCPDQRNNRNPAETAHARTMPVKTSRLLSSSKLADLAKGTRSVWARQDGLGDVDVFVASPDQMASRQKPCDSPETFHTPKSHMHRPASSGTAVATSDAKPGATEDEITVISPDPNSKRPYVRYLQGLSDDDLIERKHTLKKKAHELGKQLRYLGDKPEMPDKSVYIDTLSHYRKSQAEHDLVNAELLRRDIQDGLATPLAPDKEEAFTHHLADCAEEIEDYWQQQDDPPKLTGPAIRFFTQPHSNPYVRYVQGQSDLDLQNRHQVYKQALLTAKQEMNKTTQKNSGETGYAYQLKVNTTSLPRGKKLAQQSKDLISKDSSSQLPILGRSIFGDAEMKKLKELGEYRAELYLADVELYRRRVNRGSQEIPTASFMENILDNIDEYAEDVVSNFSPQPLPSEKA